MSSYWITGVSTDVNKLKKAPGSGNQELLNGTLASFKEQIDGVNEWISEWNNNERESIQKALSTIIDGKEQPSKYGYVAAFQYLCKYVGNDEGVEIDFFFEPEKFIAELDAKELNALKKKWEALLEDRGLGFSLPKNVKAVEPVTTFLSVIELKEILSEMKDKDLSCSNKKMSETLEGLQALFTNAYKNNKDLVLFLSRG